MVRTWGRPLAAALAAAAAWCPGALAFEVVDDKFGEGAETVHMKVLRNTDTGEYVEVVWDFGGKTQALVLKSPLTQKLRSVLRNDERNATVVRANKEWRGAMLLPYANRIKNGTYTFNGETYYLERNEDRGAYGKNALHGYLWNKKMRVADVQMDYEHAEVTLSYDFDGTDPGYPFLLSVNLTYTLAYEGFWITTRAWNRDTTGGRPLPFFNSWHSYFAVSDMSKTILELDPCAPWNHILVSNNSNKYSDLIPTGRTEPWTRFDGTTPIGGTVDKPTYFDDEFKATGSVFQCATVQTKIHDPLYGEATVLWGDSQYPWVQVYSGDNAVGKQSVAVEAMSGEADAWNNLQGMHVLQAGEIWEGSIGVKLEPSRLLLFPPL